LFCSVEPKICGESDYKIQTAANQPKEAQNKLIDAMNFRCWNLQETVTWSVSQLHPRTAKYSVVGTVPLLGVEHGYFCQKWSHVDRTVQHALYVKTSETYGQPLQT